MAPIAKYRFDIEEAAENAPSKKSRFSKCLGYLISVRFIEMLVALILFGLVVREFTLHRSHHEANLNRTSTMNVTTVTMPTTENVWSAQTIVSTENEATTDPSTTDPRTTTFDWTEHQTESRADTTTSVDLGTPTSAEDNGFTIVVISSVTTTETVTEATTESSAPTNVTTKKAPSFYFNLQERSLRYPVFFEKPDWTECVLKWMDIPEYLDRQWMALQCVQEYKKGTFVVYNTPYPGYTLDEVEKKLMMHCMMGEVFVPCAKVLNGNKIVGSPLASRHCTYCRNKPRD